MSMPITWRPSPTLVQSTRTILVALTRRWPKQIGPALEGTTVGGELFTDFAYALRGMDPRVVPLVAREYIAEHTFAPGPHELAQTAHAIAKREFPGASTAPDPIPPPPIHDGRNHARIHALQTRIRAQVASYAEVMAVWDRMLALAGTPEAEQRIRQGYAPAALVERAVRDVKATPQPEAATA